MDHIENAFKEHADVRAALAEHLVWPEDLAGLIETKRGLELLVADVDARIGRLVAEERAKGLSWATIGASLGVSKQAAQQRYATTEAEQIEASIDYARGVVDRQQHQEIARRSQRRVED